MENLEQNIIYGSFDYDLGSLYLAATENGLCFVGSLNESLRELEDGVTKLFPKATLVENTVGLQLYHQQFLDYFNGSRTTFMLPLDVKGTLFQQKVWKALTTIPYGQTKSYGEIAAEIGQSGAFRAVGTAIGKNPLLIVVPCHRVIHKNGKLAGYRRKLDMKETLLSLEKRQGKVC
ncbi:methylated-DNA--[protein]-cysteine S-methyltransferase [Carnobacterium inhibens]|uniref:Methylated-DNA--[protein]-cysteine S-methyltransferase n=1 Tax=Carnobacterium inhibens TaxID=147709 RepID=A0ABR7TE85_9LACT|nr:methylated-DNA--[protein]-cysteine S-methyltransferase [Carnobacterium inhibens]MBC9826017.1 methylated-DNA--[protein]-cysteine S-methyltransferase [Carnobacterium inhibens]